MPPGSIVRRDNLGAHNTEHNVTGIVSDKISGIGYSGFRVNVVNSDAPETIFGTNVTDEQGRYEIRFTHPTQPPDPSGTQAEYISVDVFNRAGQHVKSAARIPLNQRGDTTVDFFLLRGEAVLDDFCCFAVDHLGTCPRFRLTERKETRLLNLLKLAAPKFWKLRQEALLALMSPVNPEESCGERQKTEFLRRLRARGEFRLLKTVTNTCLPSGFPKKQFKTDAFDISYIDDQTYYPIAVDPARPAVDDELRLPDPDRTSLGWLRANLDVPTYIQQIGLIAEYSLKRFVSLSLDPRQSPSDRIPLSVCLLKSAGATSPRQTYIEIHSHNTLVQNFGTVPHELFHRVQYKFNSTNEFTGLYGVMREGGARFSEDSFFDAFNRYGLQSQTIFKKPAQSLVEFDSRCPNPISYAAALFWKYLAEQHSFNVLPQHEPDIGIDVYKQILQTTAHSTGKPYEATSLREAIKAAPRGGSFDEFRYLDFDSGKIELSSNETSWGNYLLANYLDSLDMTDTRFRYMERRDPITWPVSGTGLDPVTSLGELQVRADDLTIAQDRTISRTVVGQLPYAARYYRIRLDASSPPRMLRLSLSAFGGMTDPLIQILRFGPDGVLTDISKSDQPSYTKTINMNGVSSVVVIVASRMNGGNYTVNFDEMPGGSDVMITRWNSALGTEYELNPRDWTRTSPDLIVDTNDDGVPDTAATPSINNKLKIRLHNRGNMSSSGVRIDLHYQPAIPRLRTDLWIPVQNAANVTQSITHLALTSGQNNWSVVDWAPTIASTSGWCVKATVHAPGDLNTDNKIAIGCFNRSP
jgi:hypothetical protein